MISMRKSYRVLSLLITVNLCMSQVWAARVSAEDAALVANRFMNEYSANSAVRKASSGKQMVLKKAAVEEENLFYVYENANGEGWVIIAANDAVTPVLAYSNTGHFRMDNQPANIKTWLNKYTAFVKQIEADGVEASQETAEEWSSLRKGSRKAKGDAVVGPLITTTWDQGAPYWNSCPGTGNDKAYTGCVATAMAQVMNYWEWPEKGKGSHSYRPLDVNNPYQYSSRYTSTLSANFGNTTYDWDNMLDAYTYIDRYGYDQEISGISETAKKAVATLMYHCGVAIEMMYGNADDGGSGGYTVNYNYWNISDMPCAENAFHEFFGYKKSELKSYMRDGYGGFYSKWTEANWKAMLKTELDKKHPIMYDGSGSDGGHSFICDGYDNAGYFHFNWGWSGSNDGWYLLSDLTPGSGGAGGGSYSFSNNQSVIIGIVPDGKVMPKHNVTWSVNGEESSMEFTQGADLVLPADPASCSDHYAFMGWTANQVVNGNKPADLFSTADGKTVTEAVTYYAVFARINADTPEQTDTYTFTSGTWTDETNSWTSDKDAGSYRSDKNGVQVSKTTTGAGATSRSSFSNVNKVTVTYCTTASQGAGAMKVSIGEESAIQYFTNTGGTTLRNVDFEFDHASGDMSFIISCTTNSIFIHSISITTGGASYSHYGLDCSAMEGLKSTRSASVKTQKILINGQLYILHGDKMYDMQGRAVNKE